MQKCVAFFVLKKIPRRRKGGLGFYAMYLKIYDKSGYFSVKRQVTFNRNLFGINVYRNWILGGRILRNFEFWANVKISVLCNKMLGFIV
jgi:hypothetical protein